MGKSKHPLGKQIEQNCLFWTTPCRIGVGEHWEQSKINYVNWIAGEALISSSVIPSQSLHSHSFNYRPPPSYSPPSNRRPSNLVKYLELSRAWEPEPGLHLHPGRGSRKRAFAQMRPNSRRQWDPSLDSALWFFLLLLHTRLSIRRLEKRRCLKKKKKRGKRKRSKEKG